MAVGMESTKYQNIYQRTSSKRRNLRDGKMDVCYYFVYRADGKKVWEKVGWKSEGFTAQVASQLRLDRLQALRLGESAGNLEVDIQSIPPKPMTFGEAWKLYREKWLPNLARPKEETIRYNSHIGPRFGDVPLEAITPLELETFKQELLAKGLAASSVKYVLGNIRRVYNKLTEWELYSGRIPTTSLKMPKVDNARIRYLTPGEAEQLLANLKIRSLAWWRVASVSLHTGMRLSEVLNLTRGDLDLEANVIHVRFGKTGVRMAHINETLKSLFNGLSAREPSALLFPAANQTVRNSTGTSKTFNLVIKDLGLNKGVVDRRQKVVFHTLRHTFASWLAIEGVPLYTISNLMGHSSLEMTKRYAHLCPDVKQEAVAKIDEVAKRGKSAISETAAMEKVIAAKVIDMASQVKGDGAPEDDDRIKMEPMSQPRVFIKRRSK